MQVLPDIYCLPIQIVNVCFVGNPQQPAEWILIDAGMPESAEMIIRSAEGLFGTKPRAIILTHGHFDHVGAIAQLIERWDVPVYAHPLEMPYLTGRAEYPPPDDTVEGGLVPELSRMFPHSGINLEGKILVLPPDGSVPHMPEWGWMHTPGHAPGHVSLFRERDRALIAGDAFCTVKEDYLHEVVMQEPEVYGPPRYFTPDWDAARESVKLLASLNPVTAVAGHGRPMAGPVLAEGLRMLAERFDEIAVPDKGRYVNAQP
ncbi:MBL fold metallo-hydrolase [Paenibacillus xerothermodurans]|uniref:MBL fold metallo-hydrolase n=1 Tax=Paenibacillus xerothermodurans TaxID=1977292 RepID=A0A2W1NYN8_PAEXE|nr:MBL fold metallo-hydrolase [Paenibacillus xerothermodurans]PZE22866.1 MBL fold metallo-hydrolase [Paenibacillus xerothermodurans]